MMAQRQVVTNNVARNVSSNVDVSYLRGAAMPSVYHKQRDLLDLFDEPDNKFNMPWVDPLSTQFQRLARLNKKTMESVKYDGQPITTLSYKTYGTTSLWYIILLVSGYAHPHEIPIGAKLLLPRIEDIDKILKQQPVSNRGRVVTT